MNAKRYRDFNSYLKGLFGCRVQKIALDAGLGCPNRDGKISKGGCIYCDSKGSGTGAFQEGLSISDQILLGKECLSRRYGAKKFIAYFQSFSNTYGEFERLKALYEEALSVPDIVGLSIGTRPDCVDQKILGLLERYASDFHVWIEYGIQSAHDRTLRLIRRGHGWQAFVRAVEKTRGRRIRICTHLIIGLPGESREDVLSTGRMISGLGLDGVKIHCLYVIRGTPMEELYRKGLYRCLSQEQYIDWVCDLLEILPPEMVIQRITSDPDPNTLIAPRWTLKKSDTLNKIDKTLEERNSHQGIHFDPSSRST